MKEDIIEVLMYLFDNYSEDNYEIDTDEDVLRSELLMAGFGDSQVSKAFEWLEGLVENQEAAEKEDLSGNKSLRLFSQKEIDRLDTECRGFLLHLEQARILGPQERELVLDRVMALESDEVDLSQLKWIVMMVLLNQPGKELDFAWMEDIVMESPQSGLH
ncbi:MAG: DUF494 domain-containing protein [Gammaproteobacteria bacterium]|nr:DUF494 domain-containing protein [Gammaproteobacteria bacterium]